MKELENIKKGQIYKNIFTEIVYIITDSSSEKTFIADLYMNDKFKSKGWHLNLSSFVDYELLGTLGLTHTVINNKLVEIKEGQNE